MNTFKVNGKTYKQKELDFNAMCDLEQMGGSVIELKSKSMSFMRAYLAFCGNMSEEEAGNEIMAHLQNGGKFDEISKALNDAVKDSGFFRALKEGAETENAESETEENEKAENTEH